MLGFVGYVKDVGFYIKCKRKLLDGDKYGSGVVGI